MRLIGTIQDERRGLAFSSFLRKQGIQHQVELSSNTDWGSPEYGTTTCKIWIQDEDRVEEAVKFYTLFMENPHAPQFNGEYAALPPKIEILSQPTDSESKDKMKNANESSSSLGWEEQAMGPITRFLLILCCLLFFGAQFLIPKEDLAKNTPFIPLFSSPIERAILYDYPKTYELVSQFIAQYGYNALQDTTQLPPEGKALVREINQTPYWQGIYSIFKKQNLNLEHPTETLDAPMFEKIRQGEVWRLFTPCLFHGDLFHLFFNMIWLIVLGKQLEQRLKPVRYILFMLIVGILSNTAQYLVGGPNFIGFSGILCGMLAFVWVRQQRAAWESYQVERSTLVFMLLFVLGMAALQIFSFFLEKTTDISVSPGLANTAHLAGGVIGYALGYLDFFRWKSDAAVV